LASNPDQEFDESILLKPLDINDYLIIIRRKVLDQGPYGFINLLDHFRKIDINHGMNPFVLTLIWNSWSN